MERSAAPYFTLTHSPLAHYQIGSQSSTELIDKDCWQWQQYKTWRNRQKVVWTLLVELYQSRKRSFCFVPSNHQWKLTQQTHIGARRESERKREKVREHPAHFFGRQKQLGKKENTVVPLRCLCVGFHSRLVILRFQNTAAHSSPFHRYFTQLKL